MLRAIYTVLLQGKLGRSSIIYGYLLCVPVAFPLAGLKWGMSCKLPKWQRWGNKRGESWKTTIFHFCVAISCHTAAFMFLSYTPASLHPALFVITPTKKKFLDFADVGCVVVSLYRWLTWNVHSLQIPEADICTRKCWRNQYDVDFVAPLWLFLILGAPLTIDLLLQLMMT